MPSLPNPQPRTRPALAWRVAGLLAIAAVGLACDTGDTAPAADAGGRGAAPKERSDPRPNVVLITIDTLRADALGAYGNPLEATPELDAIAARGVLFEQCGAAAPSTLPSHASILTGKYPYAHGARANSQYKLDASQTSLAERLQAEGYVTGAEIAAVVLTRPTQLDQGFDHYRDTNSPDVSLQAISRPDGTSVLETRPGDDVTAKGIDFLRRHAHEPFFLWLHYFDPHDPYEAPEPFRSRFVHSPYHGEVAFADHQVGRFTAELERLGLTDDTLLVLTSDHGEGLSEHGEKKHASFIWQTTLRVPCILAGPGLPAGQRVPAPVRTIDLAPTVLDSLGLAPLEEAQGETLLPLARGASGLPDRLVYGESVNLALLFGASTLRSARLGPWKYIHQVDPALFHLERDPNELENLASREPQRLEALRTALRDLLESAPPPPQDTQVSLSRATLEQLQALGYVTDATLEGGADLDAFEVRGASPETLVRDVDRFGKAHGLLSTKQTDAAIEIFGDLYQRYPATRRFFEGYAEALALAGRAKEAERIFTEALPRWSSRRDHHDDLVRLRLALGDQAGAESALQGILALWPCDAAPRLLLARHTGERGDLEAKRDVLDGVDMDCDANPEVQNELAWLLATAPDASLRDGRRAIVLAREANAALPDQPLAMDTLAAAHAEAGDYVEAVAVSRRALERAKQKGMPAAAQQLLADHLALFERGEPLRE